MFDEIENITTISNMFDDKSRYKKREQITVKDRKGREVKVVTPTEATAQPILGYHLRKQGQRTDHLAAKYLNNPAGFWQISEANDAMLPEALTEKQEVAIPAK